jgi:site-specific DNA recombinase
MPTAYGKLQDVGPKRVAIYARYSTDLQRPSSIDDQIRECRDAAARNGWTVMDSYIRSDESSSGQVLVGRDGLNELMTLAQLPSRPFDGILLDDSSRFGRNLSDTLPLSDLLENADVFLYFANRSLDSRDPNFRTLFIAYGQQDEQYSRALGEKVHRGQRGRVLNGYLPNGRVYGYVNVPIENPNRTGLYGRPFVEAVKLEVNPEEAAVLVRIFGLYVGGLGCRAIAKKLNEEGIPSPLKGQSHHRRVWNTFSVSSMLTNEKYLGVHHWNRTRVVRNPKTHRKEQRPRPESEWERVEVPEWRIVSEELWNAAVAVHRSRQGPSWVKVGGLNRSEASREYIFSGVMVCAECGSSFNIVGGKGPMARYGCIGHRYRGTCTNKLTVLRMVVEGQLLRALSHNLAASMVREVLCQQFGEQATKAWKQRASKAQQATSGVAGLREKKERLRQQAENLLDAMAETKGSSLVYGRLNSIEAQMRNVDELLANQREIRSGPLSTDDLQKFLVRKLADVEGLLAANPKLAKQCIARHVRQLVMGPMFPQDGPKYEVSGDVRLFAVNPHENAVPRLLQNAGNSSTPGSLMFTVAA